MENTLAVHVACTIRSSHGSEDCNRLWHSILCWPWGGICCLRLQVRKRVFYVAAHRWSTHMPACKVPWNRPATRHFYTISEHQTRRCCCYCHWHIEANAILVLSIVKKAKKCKVDLPWDDIMFWRTTVRTGLFKRCQRRGEILKFNNLLNQKRKNIQQQN